MAMAEDPLKLYWDHFFKAETGTYEKSTWLDLFLAEFLLRLNGGADPKELINFCPVSGVVTLVGCELLCGIHRVTSSLSAHCSPKDSEVSIPVEEKEDRPTSLFTKINSQSTGETLRKYLLGGVAWRCLALLRALGVEMRLQIPLKVSCPKPPVFVILAMSFVLYGEFHKNLLTEVNINVNVKCPW